jgi:predicted N-formylglutamate amidohydrolase
MTRRALILTCEHGGNRVPARYAAVFASERAKRALRGHRGYDVGALQIARKLARAQRVPLHYSTVTRLLVELNRSPSHPRLFSEFSRRLDVGERTAIVERYYVPHRRRVLTAVRAAVRRGAAVCHVAVHSYAPALAGKRRSADIGLLYDPARGAESELCALWQRVLHEIDPRLRVRRNYPYLGSSDGFTTFLRRRFAESEYLGIELEINQALLVRDRAVALRTTRAIVASLERLRDAVL